MARFVLTRILSMIPVLWLVATVTFFLMHAAPGSPWDAKVSGGRRLDPALEASFNRRYGLDKPLAQQYLIYLGNAVQLDFGDSYTQRGTSAVNIIMRGFPYSRADWHPGAVDVDGDRHSGRHYCRAEAEHPDRLR